METEKTTETEVVADTTAAETEGAGESITLTKAEYDKLNQTLGSLKRENKDLKKPKEETAQKESKPESSGLLQKSFLRAAQITHPEDVELALTTAKKWGIEVDELVDDADFQVKLEKARTARTNADATSNIRSGKGPAQVKNTTEYWQAKGERPSPADVPDRKTRVKIIRDMMKLGKSNGKKFYND